MRYTYYVVCITYAHSTRYTMDVNKNANQKGNLNVIHCALQFKNGLEDEKVLLIRSKLNGSSSDT